MLNVILENLVNILAAALIALIGILGSAVTLRLNERTALGNINLAQQELMELSRQTVAELSQTVVEQLKAGRADGKLTENEVKALGALLVEKTLAKLSKPTEKLLTSAGVDIIALIHGSAEDYINGN